MRLLALVSRRRPMTTFAAPGLEAKVPEPTKHVNYTLGMVLGVDDFNQEFAYLSGRDQWLARDAVGYGTLVGLRVGKEATADKGPRLNVSSGAALVPPGRLVCVKPAQCGYLNDWLAAHKNEVRPLLGSPLATTLPLYLTLCYRDCPVDPVPIPGEPCRSESELMAPSRLADSFLLELRPTPPAQWEEDLVREFVTWMRMLAFGGGGPYATVEQLVSALRDSVREGPASPPGSPLASSGVHLEFGSPLASLRLDPALASEYFRAAFRVWATEIRPRVHPVCGCEGACGCSSKEAPADDECLLLARVDVPVVNVGDDEWRVDDTRTIAIDESRRPVVVSLRLLQEWAITGAGTAPTPTPTPIPSGPTVVAGGIVGAGGSQGLVLGNLTVAVPGGSLIRLSFDGYAPPDGTFQYLVKAIALVDGVGNPTLAFSSFAADGALLRVTNGAAVISDGTLSSMRFMVEITKVQ
jgi:hypothetical protein